MLRAAVSSLFAFHVHFERAQAKSYAVSSTTVVDAAAPFPEKATRCLFKTGPDHHLFKSGPDQHDSHVDGSLAEDAEGSFAYASMQFELKLRKEGKIGSSSGCEVWHGSLDQDAGHYYGWYSPSWGNLLSEYWEARGAAALAGVKFEGTAFPEGSWLSKLPYKHDADPALKDASALKEMCNDCTAGMFPHGCAGKWTRIRRMIRDDTQAALLAYSHEAHQPLPTFNENDVLVHVRFDPDHPQIAYYAKSFFDGRIPDKTSNIILLSVEPEWGKPILDSYKKMFQELCQHRQPQCDVERHSGTQFNDFAAIALAPTVFCVGSTYCLWAAMANRGRAYMSSHLLAEEKNPPIDDWTWVTGHVKKNAERNGTSLEQWVSHVAQWVQEN